MPVSPYLNFSGNTREVLNYYREIFGGEPMISTYGEMPEDPAFFISEADQDKVLHAQMVIAGTPVMFSDVLPEMGAVERGNAMSLAIFIQDAEEIKRYFDHLSQDGIVTMPLGATFWTQLFGMVTDKFGVQWMLSLEA